MQSITASCKPLRLAPAALFVLGCCLFLFTSTAASAEEKTCEQIRAETEMAADQWWRQRLADCDAMYPTNSITDQMMRAQCRGMANMELYMAYSAAAAAEAACIAARAASQCMQYVVPVVVAGGTTYCVYKVCRTGGAAVIAGPAGACASLAFP